jgi:hypothetical protein
MALTSCRECGKEISDQAEVCPSCGIKNPANGRGTNKPTSVVDGSDPILVLGAVTVTRTLAKFPSQTFPINGIGSVTLLPPKKAGLLVFGGILALIGIIALANGGGGGGAFFLVCGFVVIGVALSKKHGLFIKTASGDVRAMEGDETTLERVKQAIERAATMRG